MAQVSFFIDGFNFYHAIADDPAYRAFRWLDLKKLCLQFVRPQDTLGDVFYFTALANWNPQKVERHKLFIRAQEYNGVKVIFGEFRRTTKTCRLCGKTFPTFEEKETDVNIATQLFEQAYKETYDTAIIISGDSDQLPALRAVRRNFPSKQFGIAIPPGRGAELLKKEADFHRKIKTVHLQHSLLPRQIKFPDGHSIECPPKWL